MSVTRDGDGPPYEAQRTGDSTADASSGLPLGMPSARKLSAHELSLLLAWLLDAQPAHGSALGDRIERLSQGFYRPSPGSLYPVLSTLADQRRIAQTRQGRRKIYTLTDAGQSWLQANAAIAERTCQRLQRAGRKLSAMRRAYELNMPIEESSTLAQSMLEARMDLKAALHASLDLPPSAQRRIISALTEMATFIRTLEAPPPAGQRKAQDRS